MATTNKNGARGGGAGRIAAGFFKVLGTLLLIGVVTAAFLACFGAVYIREVILPDAHVEAQAYSTALASTIYYTDRTTGEAVELQSLYGAENRVWIPYSEIPKNLINATVAIEDKRFWDHQGVDWIRTGKAVLSMMTGDDIQGGSTLTQQLLKNMTQYKDVTVKRKIVEIFRALDFEKNHTKEEILELYLNYIYLGQKCYGVSTAAENYFGKDVRDLTLAECASLISITNNPSIYNPYIAKAENPNWGRDNNAKRALNVLYAMKDQGKITQSEYDGACSEIKAGLNFTRGEDQSGTGDTNILSWYSEQVVRDVISDLVEEKGYSNEVASNMVYSGGLKIYACVDPDVQAVVDEVYLNRDNLPQTSSTGEQLQSAIVVLDHDGNVVAMAGAMGEKTANKVLNMATMTTRQPGSSIKPLAAYAPAIDMGLITPNSVFDDTPVMALNGSAWPSNSYAYYWGRETVSKAVEQSSNTVAARVVQLLGVEKSYEFLEESFGISTLAGGDDKGLSQLALGGLHKGVRVIDMAAAYSVFPRNGVYVEPRTYTKVTREEDGEEIVILDNTQGEPRSAVKATTAWYINDMLKDVINSPNGVGTGHEAYFDGTVIAGKTGSTNDYKDRWFVGYSQYYTAAVWTGYADHPERVGPGSKNPAAQMWKKVMEPIHQGLEKKDFDQPEELLTVQICLDSGKRASPDCMLDPRGNRVQSVYFFKGDAPADFCDLHETREVCTAAAAAGGTEDGGAAQSGSTYYLATEFCPREGNAAGVEPTVKEIALLNLQRERVNGARVARDENYLWENVETAGSCTVHTEELKPPAEYDPSIFDPDDPSTYPPEGQEGYEDFDPLDPQTWPIPPVQPTPDPEGPEDPGTVQPTPTPSDPEPGGEVAPPAI